MLRHIVWTAGLFDPEDGVPTQYVGTDKILNHIQDAGVAHQIVEPLEQQVRLVAVATLDGLALFCLEELQPASEIGLMVDAAPHQG